MLTLLILNALQMVQLVQFFLEISSVAQLNFQVMQMNRINIPQSENLTEVTYCFTSYFIANQSINGLFVYFQYQRISARQQVDQALISLAYFLSNGVEKLITAAQQILTIVTKLGVQLKLILMVIISLDKDYGANVVQNVRKKSKNVFQLDHQY